MDASAYDFCDPFLEITSRVVTIEGFKNFVPPCSLHIFAYFVPRGTFVIEIFALYLVKLRHAKSNCTQNSVVIADAVYNFTAKLAAQIR